MTRRWAFELWVVHGLFGLLCGGFAAFACMVTLGSLSGEVGSLRSAVF